MFEGQVSEIIAWIEGHGIRVSAILIFTFVLASIGRRSAEGVIERIVEGKDPSEKMRSDTLERVVGSTAAITIWTIGLFMLLSELGVDPRPILAGAGVAGVALGFGAQYMVRDFLAGLFVVIENQYRIGDIVSINDTTGKVEDITLRKVVLRDLNGTVHHIPHGEAKQISNMSQEFAVANVSVGVAYNEDIEHVAKTMNKIGEEMFKNKEWSSKLKEQPRFLRIDELGDSVVKVSMRAITGPLDRLDVLAELRARIKNRFEKEDIEMPYPRMEVYTFPNQSIGRSDEKKEG